MMLRALTVLSVLSPLVLAQGTTLAYRIPFVLDATRGAVLETTFDLGHRSGTEPDLLVFVEPGAERDLLLAWFPEVELVRSGVPFGGITPTVPDPGYYTTAEILQQIDQFVAAHPAYARRVDLTTLPGAARTHGNQSIWALVISDNVASEEDEPAIVLAAQHHARELNSPHIVIGAATRILSGRGSDPVLATLVDDYEIWLVPCVNPDGVNHVWAVDDLWRKNRRNNGTNFGVDLNRNYPTGFGLCGSSTNTGSQTYRGPSPASEPETQTMRALIASVRPEIYIDIHSSGREVLHTYAPCLPPNATIDAFLDRYVDSLRSPMNYAARDPSASGEAPEDHWTSSGTMSFLVEIGTAFQPPFAETVLEEARVWPGLRQAFTTWRPAVRGHVRSLRGLTPLEATVTYTPNQFSHGEVDRSRGRDGRYALWLPLGTWRVTWSAPGHESQSRDVVVTNYDNPFAIDVDLLPNFVPATLSTTGNGRVGTAVGITYTAPGDVGLGYWIPLSLGTSPGVQLDGRTLPLNPDALMAASLSLSPVLENNLGILGASSTAVATLNVPDIPALAGVTLHVGGLTLDASFPSGIARWAPPVSVTIQP
ncbi:MAG: M14 family zinc carboxypeptidase [Planctomycetota bacterium]